jgi:23S rRNA (uridine2552-2'-O)-methyltransferase
MGNKASFKGRSKTVQVKNSKGRKVSSTNWLKRQLNDPYVKLAQKENYRSRSAFKLLEIDKKFNIIKNSLNVVDLGAAPGGWLQVVRRLNVKAKIVGVDLQLIDSIDNVELIQGDFLLPETKKNITDQYQIDGFDLILSDMSPKTSGHNLTDHWRILDLADNVLEFAIEYGLKDSNLVCKLFKGGEENEFIAKTKKLYGKVRMVKPESSRKESSEMFLVALKKK